MRRDAEKAAPHIEASDTHGQIEDVNVQGTCALRMFREYLHSALVG
jgi:hypothetical protein